jgi:protein-disulfide isomerase/uncharacterized membrane protein
VSIGRIVLRIVVVLAAGGAAWVASALHRAHLLYNLGAGAGGFLCRDYGLFNCNEIAAHSTAWPLGVPLTLVGVVFYVLMLYLAIVAALYRGPARKAILALATILSGIAVLLLIYLAIVMVAMIRHICLTSLVLYGLTIVTFLAFWALDRNLREPVQWSRALPSLLLWRGSRGDLHRNVFKIGTLILLVIGAHVTLGKARVPMGWLGRVEGASLEPLPHVLSNPPEIDVALLANPKALGPPDAELTFVLAGDYEDHLTRTIAQELARLRARWPEGVREIFVNVPLDEACNPKVTAQYHANACWLAQAAECAREQGKFWEFHRYVFGSMANQTANEQTIGAVLEEIGLDRQRFEACMASSAPLEAVIDETRRWAEAGVEVVPTVVINGHPRPGRMPPRTLQRVLHFFRTVGPTREPGPRIADDLGASPPAGPG